MNVASRIPTALTSATMRTAARSSASTAAARPIAQTTVLIPTAGRALHTSPSPLRAPEPSDSPGAMPDGLSERPAKGTTGGGERMESSAPNSAPKPKISNLSVPGVDGQDKLTEEQKKEVEEHNKDFEAKHDRGNSAADDKVDKSFWSDQRGTE